MEKCFVDTNIFVEVFTRFGKKSDSCKRLLKTKENLLTSSLIFSEVEWVLRSFYELPKKDVVRCLEKILTLNIDIDNKKILMFALQFYKDNSVDWTDCLSMSSLKNEGVSTVYSYDKGLRKFDWVKRLEP